MIKARPFAATLIVCLVSIFITTATTDAAQSPELRGMWVSRYEWPNANESNCKATISQIMTDAQDANFNAVFFQIRGQADVLYPSPYEVWSPLIGGTDPGWDPLEYAITQAHAHGLEFHAYMNFHTCWQDSAGSPPSNPNHLFWEHCNAADPNARDWLHYENPETPVQFSESDYVWIAPGVPDFQAYIRQQMLYVVTNYDVDGIHYDRIRTPWSYQPSYDAISMVRFNDLQSNPDSLDISSWTTDQITRNVRDVAAAVMAVKPQVKISAAVYSNPSSAPYAQHQDALTWAATGGLDMLVPMMYFSGGQGSSWDSRLQTWINESSGRHVVAGHITSQGVSSLIEQIYLTRLRGAQGNAVFSYSSFPYWANYTSSVYTEPVSTPTMTWKDNPTTAIVYGYITNAFADPVVDAQVTRSGSAYTGLSTGDGFYSLHKLPPGTYTITASSPGYDTAIVQNVTVTAGQVLQQDINLGTPPAPEIANVTPDPDHVTAGDEYQIQLLLTRGAADEWTVINGPMGATVNSLGLVSGWTPQESEVGDTFNFTVRATNDYGHHDESWSVIVDAVPPCQHHLFADFEQFVTGTRIMFNRPRYSGTTVNDLDSSLDVGEITDDVQAYSGDQSFLVRWQYVDTDPQRWMRLTTYYAPEVPNPTIELDRPIRIRLRVDEGRFRLAIGVRETGTNAEVGEDGGTTGTIEWIGADSDNNGAPQGILVEPMPGVWQTFVFNPLTDPIHGLNGNGTLYSLTNKGTLEHIAFSIVDTAGPFTVYLDDIELLCGLPQYGDFNGDADVNTADYEIFEQCLTGPNTPLTAGCEEADADDDTDIDLKDFARFQKSITN